jgi:hypothetical protein
LSTLFSAQPWLHASIRSVLSENSFTDRQKEHSASFIPPSTSSKSTAPIPYSAENGQYAPFIALDCRGLEFTTFHFRGKWLATGEESGTPFEIDFEEGVEEGRWDDYDEKAEAPVAVSECKAKIERF